LRRGDGLKHACPSGKRALRKVDDDPRQRSASSGTSTILPGEGIEARVRSLVRENVVETNETLSSERITAE